MSEIVIAKVRTGEVIIGKLVGEKIEKCIQAKPMPISQQQMQIAMAPFFPMMSDDFVDIDMKDIITTAKPVKDLEDKYLESVSGIVIASGGSIPTMPGTNITKLRRK
jgi:hypothetical protein